MGAKYLLTGLAVGFLVAGLLRVSSSGDLRQPQARAWLIIAVIFGAVSVWLWSRA